jgi:hypothetical protein
MLRETSRSQSPEPSRNPQDVREPPPTAGSPPSSYDAIRSRSEELLFPFSESSGHDESFSLLDDAPLLLTGPSQDHFWDFLLQEPLFPFSESSGHDEMPSETGEIPQLMKSREAHPTLDMIKIVSKEGPEATKRTAPERSPTQEGSSPPRDMTDPPQSKKTRKGKETAKPEGTSRRGHSLTEEGRKRLSEAGKRQAKESIGIWGLSKEERSKRGQKGGQTAFMEGKGIFEKMEDGRLKGEVAREEKHKVTPEDTNKAINTALCLVKKSWMR